MPITVPQVESFVIATASWLMGRANLSVSTDGTNPDLRVPIDLAFTRFLDLEDVPLASATINVPTDADLARLAGWQVRPFLAACLVETLHLVRARLVKVDEIHGIHAQKLSQYGNQIDSLLSIWEPRAWVSGRSEFAIGSMDRLPDPGMAGLNPMLSEPADGWLIP